MMIYRPPAAPFLATMSKQQATKLPVASTLLLVWTGLKRDICSADDIDGLQLSRGRISRVIVSVGIMISYSVRDVQH